MIKYKRKLYIYVQCTIQINTYLFTAMEYKKIIIQWKEFESPEVLPRDKDINLDLDFIITITGPRRAGKTFFCFQLI